MSSTVTENKIQNLEALLGLYPFDKEPEESRELENVSFDQIQRLTKKVVQPNYADISERSNMEIGELTTKLGSIIKKLQTQFESSAICPFYQDNGFNVEELVNCYNQRMMGFYAYDEKCGSLSDFIESCSTQICTVLIPPGHYRASIKLRCQINLIGLAEYGPVEIIAANGSNAITCTAPGGIIQGITFGTEVPIIYPTAEIAEGNVKFYNCTFVGSKGAAVKVSDYACANFFNCKISTSDEFALSITDCAMVKCHNTEISDGKKAGVSLSLNSAAFFKNCSIIKSECGVAIQNSASAIFIGTKIDNNSRNGLMISSDSPYNKLDQCQISKNAFYSNSSAIYVSSSSRLTIQDCEFKNNKGCIFAKDNAVLTSKFNTYTDSTNNKIVVLCDSSKMISESDTYTGNCYAGVQTTGFSTFEATQSTFRGMIVDEKAPVLSFFEKSTLKLIQCTFEQIKFCCILLRNNVQALIQGTTFRNVRKAIDFQDDVTSTIQSCKFLNFDNTAVSFKDTPGDINLVSCDFENNIMNSMTFKGKTKPNIKNCNFVGREHSKNASCLNIEDPDSEPYFENCKFSSFSTIGEFKKGCHPTFKNSEFFNCVNCIQISDASPNFDTCKFFIIMNNCFHIKDKCNSNFTNCTIEAVKSIAAHISKSGASPNFIRCKFSSMNSVAVISEEASPVFDDCHFLNSRTCIFSIVNNCYVTLNGCVFQNSGAKFGIGIDKNCTANIKKCKFNNLMGIALVVKHSNCILEGSEISKCMQGINIESAPDEPYKPEIRNNNFHHNYGDPISINGKCIVKNNTISDSTSGISILANELYEIIKDDIEPNNFYNIKGSNIKRKIPQEIKKNLPQESGEVANSTAAKLQQGTNSGQTISPGLQSLPGATAANPSALKSLPPNAGQQPQMSKIGVSAEALAAAFPPPGTASPTAAAAQNPTAIQSQYPGPITNTMRMHPTQMGGTIHAGVRTPTSPGAMATGQAAFASMNPALTNHQMANRAMPNRAMPNQPMPNQPMTNRAMPNQPMPNPPMTNQPMTNQSIANQTMTNQPMPNRAMPNRAMPNQPMTNRAIANATFQVPQYSTNATMMQTGQYAQAQKPNQNYSSATPVTRPAASYATQAAMNRTQQYAQQQPQQQYAQQYPQQYQQQYPQQYAQQYPQQYAQQYQQQYAQQYQQQYAQQYQQQLAQQYQQQYAQQYQQQLAQQYQNGQGNQPTNMMYSSGQPR